MGEHDDAGKKKKSDAANSPSSSPSSSSFLLRISPTVIPVSRDPNDDDGEKGDEFTTIALSPTVPASLKRRVPEEDTVPPEVAWSPSERVATDKGWARAFWVAYAAFLGTCIYVFSQAKPKFQHVEDGLGGHRRVVSEHFHDDVSTCCAEVEEKGHELALGWGLCGKLDEDEDYDDDPGGAGRRLSKIAVAGGASKFDGDEGVFDAFLEAPLVVVGSIASVVVLSVLWLMLLRKFSAPVVFATEALKVLFLLFLAAITGGGASFLLIMAAAFAGSVAYNRRNDLVRAAQIISHSAVALRANPRMVAGLVGIMLLYVLQACLFIGAFTASFEIVEVVARYVPRNRCPVSDDFTAVNETESYCYQSYNTEYPDDIRCLGTNCRSEYPLPPGGLEGGCVYEYPKYMRCLNQLQALLWMWSILVVDKVRLAVVGTVVGSWHFHRRNDNDHFSSEVGHGRSPATVAVAIKSAFTSSLGTLAFAATVTGIIDQFRRRQTASACCWWMWLGPQCVFVLPFQALLCLFGTCFAEALRLFTKFSVLLHVFTGLPLEKAGKKCSAIMSRHYVGGFITEYSSKSVLTVGSYLFSVSVGFFAWSWVDAAFDCTTFSDATGHGPGGQFTFWLLLVWAYFFVLLCAYPVLGVLLVMLVNSWWQKMEVHRMYEGMQTTQDRWVPPLAGAFVACVSMLLFRFVSRVILDTVDTMFLCFAIDVDNGVEDRSSGSGGGRGEGAAAGGDFGTIIKAMPEYVVACPVEDGAVDPEQPVVRGVIERDLPPEADIFIEDGGGAGIAPVVTAEAAGAAKEKSPAGRHTSPDEELAAAKKSAAEK